MGKVIRPLLIAAAVAVNVIPGAGQAISAAILASTGIAVTAVAAASIAGLGLVTAASAFGRGKALSTSALSRLNLSFNADGPRKIVFGDTAMNTDILYQEASGTDQEFIDVIIALAAHKIDAVTAIYSEDKLMWSTGAGVASAYSGYLTVDIVTEGTRSNGIAINGGGIWNADCTLTGCAYLKLRVKRTGASSKTDSPFAAGIPGRMTIIGRGMPVYDPRRDSTAGGSGPHRANDQTTWQYADGGTVLGTNPALQALTYLLGWRVGGVLSVGAGLPVARMAMADWIAAANVCDETVTLPSGSRRRYETHGVFSDDDPPAAVIDALCRHMNANLRDTGGRIGIRMAINDTGGSLIEFTEDDLLGGYDWQPCAALQDSFNLVRGKWTDPSTTALFQMVPYPAQAVASPDGIDRPLGLDLPMFQDAERAQMVAQQVVKRGQVKGTFAADFGPRAWACEVGQPVRLTLPGIGAVSKLFRVAAQELKVIGTDADAQAVCPMTLIEDDPAIYSITGGDIGGVPVAVAPVSYLPSSQPFLLGDLADVNAAQGSKLAGIAANATRNVFRGIYNSGTAYLPGDEVTTAGNDELYVAKLASTGVALTNTAFWDLKLVTGGGAAGANAVNVRLSNPLITVATAADGSGGNYAGLTCQIEVYDGAVRQDTLGTCTFAEVGSISYVSVGATSGLITITDWGSTRADPQFDATYDGVTYRVTLQLLRSLQGVAGPAVTMVGGGAFTYLDGVLTPGGQTRTLSITRQNALGTAVWTTTPGVTLTGSGDSRTLAAADMGSNRQVTIRATVGSVYDEDIVIRADATTAAAGATRDRTGTLLDAAASANEAAAWSTSGGASTQVNSTAGGYGAFINARYLSINRGGALEAFHVNRMPVGSTGTQFATFRYTHSAGAAVPLTGYINFYDPAGAFVSQASYTLPLVATALQYDTVTVSAPVPAGATQWIVYFLQSGTEDTAIWRIDNIIALNHQPGADVTANALLNDSLVLGTATPITVGALITAANSAAAPVVPVAITALGASSPLNVVIPAGGSRTFSVEVFFNLTAGSIITLSTPLEYRIGAGAWSGFGSGTGDTDTAPTVLFAEASGTLTNGTGDALNYQVRAVPAAPGGTGTVDAARSILKAI